MLRWGWIVCVRVLNYLDRVYRLFLYKCSYGTIYCSDGAGTAHAVMTNKPERDSGPHTVMTKPHTGTHASYIVMTKPRYLGTQSVSKLPE